MDSKTQRPKADDDDGGERGRVALVLLDEGARFLAAALSDERVRSSALHTSASSASESARPRSQMSEEGRYRRERASAKVVAKKRKKTAIFSSDASSSSSLLLLLLPPPLRPDERKTSLPAFSSRSFPSQPTHPTLQAERYDEMTAEVRMIDEEHSMTAEEKKKERGKKTFKARDRRFFSFPLQAPAPGEKTTLSQDLSPPLVLTLATHLPFPCLFPETHAPKPRRQNVDDQGEFVPSSSKIQVETVLSSRGWEGEKTQPLSSSSSPPLFFLFPEKPKNRSPSSSTTRSSPSRSATCCLWPSRTSSVSFFFSVFAFSFVWREREEKVLGE